MFEKFAGCDAFEDTEESGHDFFGQLPIVAELLSACNNGDDCGIEREGVEEGDLDKIEEEETEEDKKEEKKKTKKM